jgi:hypothetical protein
MTNGQASPAVMRPLFPALPHQVTGAPPGSTTPIVTGIEVHVRSIRRKTYVHSDDDLDRIISVIHRHSNEYRYVTGMGVIRNVQK